jgi:hypothetical protein
MDRKCIGSSGKTNVDMPDTLTNIIRSGTSASLSSIASYGLIPVLSLEIPDCLGKQACSDEVEKARRNHKEEL